MPPISRATVGADGTGGGVVSLARSTSSDSLQSEELPDASTVLTRAWRRCPAGSWS